MAFKLSKGASAAAESPEALVADLRAKKIPGLLSHQADVLREYAKRAVDRADVALQLPTGSGKTLVGLAIGEWRRRKFGERVVYLCLTNQLVNQVAEQADTRYGIKVTPFTGGKDEYEQAAKTAYLNAETIAITSYSAVFNVRPFFNNPQSIILDDTHAAEQYIAGHWSLRIERRKHPTVYEALTGALRPVLQATDYARLNRPQRDRWDEGWVDKIPTPAFGTLIPELTSLLDEHVDGTDLYFSWSILRDHLSACHMYIGVRDLLLRPLLPPTSTHRPFIGARQRVYMSATLGEGGELERLTGLARIFRLPTPLGWDKHGIGRRLFFFPSSSLSEAEANTLNAALIREAHRALVLTPDERTAQRIREWVGGEVRVPTFTAAEIEDSKMPFVTAANAVAVIANRYDGIDFPDDECRLLIVEGLPRAMNLQERFLVTRMGSVALLDDRILTRIVQACGRCTRSATDYAAVVIRGEELHSYLLRRERRAFLHPELQAELEFGIEQSRGARVGDFDDNVKTFLRHGEEWLRADDEIVTKRQQLRQEPLPGTSNLRVAAEHEVAYQTAMWHGEYEEAVEHARRVLTALEDPSAPELRGYRALWHYLAGSAAWFAAESGREGLRSVARGYFGTAAKAARGVRWLHSLAREGGGTVVNEPESDSRLTSMVERLEEVLEDLGTVHDRRFDVEERFIREGLKSREAKKFEEAHMRLGRLIGFDADMGGDDQGSADVWWVANDSLCFVFEDHSDADGKTSLAVKKARQAACHPAWVRTKVALAADAEVITILVSPVASVDKAAVPHLAKVQYWNLVDFQAWASRALGVIRNLRRTFPGSGDLAWRAEAIEQYLTSELDPAGLRVCVLRRLAADLPLR